MKTILQKTILLLAAILCLHTFQAEAQNKVNVHAKVDFVSDYIWRGADQNSGFSFQPSLTLSYAGLSLNVWGSQSLSKWEEGGAKEWDLNLSYAYKNFSITLSDYWWSGVNQPYGHYKHQHYFEGTLAYNFGKSFPLSLSWSTMFAGADKDADGHLRASTYISASYPLNLPNNITLTPAIGFTPWKGMYHNKAALTDLSLKASKDLKLSDHFSLPLFVQAIVSPEYDRTYLVGGFSLGF